LIGRLIQITKTHSSVATSPATVELLLTLCDRIPLKFSEQIGYGNACGILVNRGCNIPIPPNWLDEQGREVNSLTGVWEGYGPGLNVRNGSGGKMSKVHSTGMNGGNGNGNGKRSSVAVSNLSSSQNSRNQQEGDMRGIEDMTEEEKEMEFEKLMKNIERLNRTGVVKAGMPDVNSKESNERYEKKLKEEEEERVRKEEEAEMEAVEELRRYKERTRGRK
jgi:hypothetical protein